MSATANNNNTPIEVIADDMEAVNRAIRQQLHSNIGLINQISEYIINAGGKRIRPALVLLFANAFGYQGTKHHALAAVVEFIHTATLLHDDVVDESTQRRSQPTANTLFGNAAAVLVGDFIYTRSFQMMVSVDDMRVMEILSETTNVIAEGEVLQLMNVRNPDISEERYLQVIHSKTAKLFEAAAQLGALLADAPESDVLAAALYGRSLGTAFQLIDDMLDYTGNAQQIGKVQGDDLREGKMTLPLIYLRQHGSEAQRQLIRDCIEQDGEDRFDAILEAIQSSGALEYTRQQAEDAAQSAVAAIQFLPDTPYKDTLLELCTFAVGRKF